MGDLNGSAIVSRLIVDGDWDVGWMVREDPEDDADSGWRFFAGPEDEGEADVAGAFRQMPLASIVEIDPSVEPYLDAPAGTCWEREGDSDEFVEVELGE